MTDIPTDNVPTIIAANHPNAFLDALIIAAYYPKKLMFMARGDASKSPFIAKVFKALGLIPYYAGGVTANEAFYTSCTGALLENKALLVFPEGISKHADNLRPLQKPVAVLAHRALQYGVSTLFVSPVYIRYSSFSGFPQSVHVHACAAEVLVPGPEALPDFTERFNQQLSTSLQNCRQNTLAESTDQHRKQGSAVLWIIPGIIGYVLHWPLVSLAKAICKKYKERDGAYHDSMMFLLLAIAYPCLLLTGAFTAAISGSKTVLLATVLLPLTAWSYKKYKA